MTEKYSIYIISSFDYDTSVLVRLLRGPNIDNTHTEFSNYLDL
jgi:hypothetical protein